MVRIYFAVHIGRTGKTGIFFPEFLAFLLYFKCYIMSLSCLQGSLMYNVR